MAHFVEVPYTALAEALTGAGFTPGPSIPGKEQYFERPTKAADLRIRVWTSTTAGAEEAAGCGKDAIRVTLVYRRDDKSPARGVTSATRVHRTSSVEAVIERTLERARDMWRFAAKMAPSGRCLCGAPRYADSGKCVDHNNPRHAQLMAQGSQQRSGPCPRTGGNHTVDCSPRCRRED